MRPVSTEVLESGVTQPAFFVFSQAWANDGDSLNNRQFRPFYASSKNAMGAISIDGTTHYDFSDLPLLSPLAPQLGLKGPINGKRVTAIVNDFLLSFFEHNTGWPELRSLLLSRSSKILEVKAID